MKRSIAIAALLALAAVLWTSMQPTAGPAAPPEPALASTADQGPFPSRAASPRGNAEPVAPRTFEPDRPGRSAGAGTNGAGIESALAHARGTPAAEPERSSHARTVAARAATAARDGEPRAPRSTGTADPARYCQDESDPTSPDGYRYAATRRFFDLTETHAIEYNVAAPFHGNVLMEVITRAVCELQPWSDDLPEPQSAFVLMAADADITILVGERWLAHGPWQVPLSDADHEELVGNVVADRRRDVAARLPGHPPQALTRAQFAAYLALQRSCYPHAMSPECDQGL